MFITYIYIYEYEYAYCTLFEVQRSSPFLMDEIAWWCRRKNLHLSRKRRSKRSLSDRCRHANTDSYLSISYYICHIILPSPSIHSTAFSPCSSKKSYACADARIPCKAAKGFTKGVKAQQKTARLSVREAKIVMISVWSVAVATKAN